MHWLEITSDDFLVAVKKAEGVCLVPMGVLECHGHHLPLGTDMLIARELCRRADLLEPVIVFPDYIFSQIFEAKTFPGAVALEAALLLRLLEELCREIARNGLKKIVFLSGHGGNHFLLHYFAQSQLASPRDYALFVVDPGLVEDQRKELDALFTEGVFDHAGDSETSQVLAVRPELVHMERVPHEPEGASQGRLDNLQQAGAFTGIWWYASYPHHFAGDTRPANAIKGERLLQAMAEHLAATLKAIKEDKVTLALQEEFYDRNA